MDTLKDLRQPENNVNVAGININLAAPGLENVKDAAGIKKTMVFAHLSDDPKIEKAAEDELLSKLDDYRKGVATSEETAADVRVLTANTGRPNGPDNSGTGASTGVEVIEDEDNEEEEEEEEGDLPPIK